MYDHMFVETLIISSSFFAVAIILVASVIFLEKKADVMPAYTITLYGTSPAQDGRYANNPAYP